MDSRTDFVVLKRNMNGYTYADLLNVHFVPFIAKTFGNSQNCILQDDNAPSHRSNVVTEKQQEV